LNVLILSWTPITDEPRVLRQAVAFESKGWKIFACGFKGRAAKPPSWTLWNFFVEGNTACEASPGEILESEKAPASNPDPSVAKPKVSVRTKAKKIIETLPPWAKKSIYRIYFAPYLLKKLPSLFLSRFNDEQALKYYWDSCYYVSLYDFICKKIDEDSRNKPELIVAHDYYAAVIAEKLANRYNCKYIVDIHEYANGQYMHSFMWRLLFRPWIFRLQGMFISKSSLNTTVCDGIANILAQDYPSIERPTVVRSTPFYVAQPFRPAGEKIDVLYHGIIERMRGIDVVLESLPLWKEDFTLTIRGSGNPAYIDHLKAKAKSLGVDHRFCIKPSVLFHEIIPAANASDIGYFVHKDISPQKRFTLPNKFFEYIMAGTALCVSDLPEMARIVKHYNLGLLVKGYNPRTVANSINSLTRDDINLCKQNSLFAAKELCWEKESQTMLKAYEQALDANFTLKKAS